MSPCSLFPSFLSYFRYNSRCCSGFVFKHIFTSHLLTHPSGVLYFPSLDKCTVVEKKPSSKPGLHEELVFGIQLQKYKNRMCTLLRVKQNPTHLLFQGCSCYLHTTYSSALWFSGGFISFSQSESITVCWLQTAILVWEEERASLLPMRNFLSVFGREGMYNDRFVYRTC